MDRLNYPVSFNQQSLDYAAQEEPDNLKETVLSESLSDGKCQDKTDDVSALSIACINGHELVDDYLLNLSQADLNLESTAGMTPFNHACLNGHLKIVQQMLDDDRIDINKADAEGRTPFFMACSEGHDEVVNLLLKDPRIAIDINKQDSAGATPFSIACEKGQLKVVQQLLLHPHIDLNQPDAEGCTPFFMACSEGHEEVVKLLLNIPHININLPNEKGLTPFSIACDRTHLKTAQQLMQDTRTDLNAPEENGYTPFYLAYARGNIDTMRLLLTNDKVDINRKTTAGCFPLFHATWDGSIDVVRQILISGREIDLTMKDTANNLTAIELGRAMAQRIQPDESDEFQEHRRINGPVIAELLDEFDRNPDLTRKKINQLYAAELAASLFALVIFYTDNFMDFAKQPPLSLDLAKNCKRFFHTAKALPLELQMLLCNIAYDRNKVFILSKDSEGPFRNLANDQLL